MNKLLEVHDNLIPISLQNYLYNLIMGKIPGKSFPLFISNTLSDGEIEDFGFNNEFGNIPHHKEDILQVLYKLRDYKGQKINNIYINRVFLQCPRQYPFIPKPHNDLIIPHMVCLYYVNDSDGDTIFYNDNGSILKKVSPKKGRIALFDGSIKHSAGQPTKNERIVINICFS
jgi:hypothetical protein